jgi:hypothetical protein
MRLKQFIIDEFEFNLDLETWGLTSQDRELKRFEKFISPSEIAKSNALFGYEGDKYYFDVDIRKHFGLDKYGSEIIPYWKTETVEAMNAFRLKEGYSKAAGECVSLSALYAAAAFIVCGIPLEDIYMILTPLHSQNFIDIQDGVLTNNRRLVTKTMWFNGTAISNKAQRALRNESVTIVAHSSGYVHCLYEDATMDRNAYEYFVGQLNSYLSTELTLPIFANFLRTYRDYQKFFQLCRDCHGQSQFVKAEVLFHYEHGSNYRIGDKSCEKLLAEVSDEDFVPYELPGRIRCDELEKLMAKRKFDLRRSEDRVLFGRSIEPVVPEPQRFVDRLADFVYTQAKLPSLDKHFLANDSIDIPLDRTREEIVEYLQSRRRKNATADLAFYAYRDMASCDWVPFVKAAIDRNPVSVEMLERLSIGEAYSWLQQIADDSIYDGGRLAQPDEVANYKSGDGLEKAFLLANLVRQRNPEQGVEIVSNHDGVTVSASGRYDFVSNKGLRRRVSISTDGNIDISDA